MMWSSFLVFVVLSYLSSKNHKLKSHFRDWGLESKLKTTDL
jgi:hypothetical protein